LLRLPHLQLEPGGEEGKSQKKEKGTDDGQRTEDQFAEEPALPSQDEYQQEIQKTEEYLGEKADLEQLNQQDLSRVEKLLKIPEKVQQKEKQGEDEEKHDCPGHQPVQRRKQKNLTPAASQEGNPHQSWDCIFDYFT
jgi:hypothetical protein